MSSAFEVKNRLHPAAKILATPYMRGKERNKKEMKVIVSRA